MGFKFPNCFTTKKAVHLGSIFSRAEFPEDYCLDIDCNIKNDYRMLCIFDDCRFPKGFTIGAQFSVEEGVKSEDIFYDCYLNGDELSKLLPFEYARDVINYLKDSYRNKCYMIANNHYVCKNDLAKHLSQALNVSKDSVCDAINLFAQKYSDEDSNTESEGMNLF